MTRVRVAVFLLVAGLACVPAPAPAAADEGCDASGGPVLFTQRAAGHFWRADLRRTLIRFTRHSRGQDTELAYMDPDAAAALWKQDQWQGQLLLFGRCYSLPAVTFRREGLGGMRIYEAAPSAAAHFLYIAVRPRTDSTPQEPRMKVHIILHTPRERIEILPLGDDDPIFGERFGVRRMAYRRMGGQRFGRSVEAPASYPPKWRLKRPQIVKVRALKPLPNQSIDVLVAYSSEMRDMYASDGDLFTIKSAAESSAIWWEGALNKSGFTYEVNVTGVIRPRITEADYQDALGVVDSLELLKAFRLNWRVNIERAITESDFAVLLALNAPQSLGFVWKPLSSLWQRGALTSYSVVQASFVEYGFAHECGHNIGCGHVFGTDAQEDYAHATCVQWMSGGLLATRCTVMAGGRDFSRLGASGGAPLQRYSDPLAVHVESGKSLGEDLRDNRRLLQRNLEWAANWGRVFGLFAP